MGRKTTPWTFYATSKRHLTQELMDVAKKGKPCDRKRISSNSSTKQYYKNQYYQSKNR